MLLFETEARTVLNQQECDFLTSLFSDETESYRSPAEPDAGDTVKVRLRALKSPDCRVWLVFQDRSDTIQLNLVKENEYFSWYEAEFVCPDHLVSYCFLVENGGRSYICKRFTSELMDKNRKIDFVRAFRISPGFHTPDWAKGALQYQIFVDRFRNGNPANDPVDGEYCYEGVPIRKRKDWYAIPDNDDYRCFYGGDFQGVAEKLDYLKSLGVEVIYFNPIFLSPSNHKYDTQDYDHVDPHFAVIDEDLEDDSYNEDPWEMDRYVKRVTSKVNLKESNDYFAWVCGEIHKRGMRLILDGVFNHCGSFNRWMDGKNIYARAGEEIPGAWQSDKSPYRNFFRFDEKGTNYDSWWGHPTLPKLNYEGSPELCEEVFRIACKWASEPYSIDGWRLDVAADLGHSVEFNHWFWSEFRKRVKAVNPDILIIAEHYGNPGDWLKGDQWDSVMNYDAFMDPVGYFLTGMEKHSDYFHDGLYQDGPRFFRGMRDAMSNLDLCSLQCAMNELSNHDHARFLTRTNRTAGRLATMGGDAAAKDVDKRVFREAVMIQMTWPGAPTIYYGDEAGLVGWTDPDNRRCYPWGREDQDLIDMHRSLAALRRSLPVLRKGSLKALDAGNGWIAYSRFNETDRVITVCNNGNDTVLVRLHLRDIGAAEGEEFSIAFRSDGNGWSDERKNAGTVKDGYIQLLMASHSAVILVQEK